MLAQGFRGDFSVRAINVRHVFIRFTVEEDYTRLWLKPIWFINGFPMRVFKWTPTFNLREESPIVPVWVRLLELPIQFFNQEALFSIAQLLGTPLRTDVFTTTLVRPSVARVCVEVNLLKPLQTEIGLSFETEVVIQPLIYERLPKYCGVYKHLGHDETDCYEKNKSKAPVRPALAPALAREDLRVKLDAQRSQRDSNARDTGKRVFFDDSEACPHNRASTSDGKGDTDALHGDEVQLPDVGEQEPMKPSHDMFNYATGDVLHGEVSETVLDEVVQSPDPGNEGTTAEDDVPPGISDFVAPSQDPEMPAVVMQEPDEAGAPERSNVVQEVEQQDFAPAGAGAIQVDDFAVARVMACHRRGRSMGDEPGRSMGGYMYDEPGRYMDDVPESNSTSSDREMVASPPRRV
ncbi:UNVERIFIED_CONTAM: hypothetical protein Slati_0849800, partial [Sesamum latifolium]